MADEQFERIETDSTAELRLSVTDSLELGAAADDRAPDADYGETGDILGSGPPFPGSTIPGVRHSRGSPFPGSTIPGVRHSRGRRPLFSPAL